MGMVFFGMMVLGVLRRKTGHVVARASYAKTAERLGLSYVPSAYRNGVGRMEGEFQGYRVTVDPDDQKRILLKFKSAPAVEMHSYVHNKRPAPGQRSFRPSSRVLSAQFRTCQASPELIDAVERDEALSEALRPLKFLRQLKTLSVTANGITAVFDYGSPSYIPSEVVQDVLPRLVSLAQIFEPGHAKDEAK